MYGARHLIATKIINYQCSNYLFYILNLQYMFTFYCIIFSKLSKNKSRKMLVLCLTPWMPLSALCVYFFITKLRLAHSINQQFYGGSAPSPMGAAPGPHRGHVPLNRVRNGQCVR